jgi:xanthine dehydrogenase accessory factor
VETKGSTPQKAGAMMLVAPDGRQWGTLGGGCVENEVKLKALRRFDQAGAAVDVFVLDHDYAWADGLICGGKMVILSELVAGSEAADYFEAELEQLAQGRGFSESIVVDPERAGFGRLGSRLLLDHSAVPAARFGLDEVPRALIESLVTIDDRPRPHVSSGVAVLPHPGRIDLVIVGAGHVGQAVAELAARADFDVRVVDDRAQYANRDRFPASKQLIVGPIEQVLADLEVTPSTYCLIVTRGHGHDEEALLHLAPTAASYVGLIGSKRKIKMIFESLREQGISGEALDRVSAPVGYDIGSQTVFEIAVSIVAELIARRNLGRPSLASKLDERRSIAAE